MSKSKSAEDQVLEVYKDFQDLIEVSKSKTTKGCLTETLVDLDIPARIHKEDYPREKVKQAMQAVRLNRILFAKFLGVSPDTIDGWLYNKLKRAGCIPSPSAQRLIDEILRDPVYWAEQIRPRLTRKKLTHRYERPNHRTSGGE